MLAALRHRCWSFALLASCALALTPSSFGCQVLAGLDEPLSGPRADGGRVIAPGTDGGGTVSEYAAAVLKDGPVLYLRFSETTGPRVADSSGRDQEHFAAGAFERGRPGLIHGDSDPSIGLENGAQVALAEAFDYPFEAEFTYELWVRLTKKGAVMGNVINSPPNLLGTTFYVKDQAPNFGFERWSSTLVSHAHVDGPIAPSRGGIYHLVIVSGRVKPTIFINGAGNEDGLHETRRPHTPAAMLLAHEAWGDFDEVAIYDKALSAARIAAHYGLGRAPD